MMSATEWWAKFLDELIFLQRTNDLERRLGTREDPQRWDNPGVRWCQDMICNDVYDVCISVYPIFDVYPIFIYIPYPTRG